MVKCVLMFPGQGAQKVGMGRDLAERFPQSREVFESIDDALGVPLSRLMWEGPQEELTLTHNAQPAILAHSMAVHEVVAEKLAPVAAAGHSLGEYSAFAAAGSLAVTDAARLVRRRGELMHEAGQQRTGTMSAVLGLRTETVESACRDASSGGAVAVAANMNTRDQTVISGDPEAVDRAGAACKAAGAKRVVPLDVSGAFHSPLMEPAKKGLEVELEQIPLEDPRFPVVANASAEAVSSGKEARKLLAAQLISPVRWSDSMERANELAGSGVQFIELGPGAVLTGLLKRIVPDASRLSIATADAVEAFLEQHA